ncbi:hypothetical protein OYT1_ch2473 [Ferriphaselus amnicola]|uniref:Tyrosine specific protein phosphatases domain-containing protein n=1 Tax=Ferriphaselus amnicola TaxID=1188319 RepID=A0A2Z6GEI9_9PROT|nr:hypothetical protein [Ferriphaselus amnicola]BBE51986.1 hypothetical protein OYT1_ch2473 [Ferriphaselus amnicola]
MLKNVIFESQKVAESRPGWSNWSVISITSTNSTPANIQSGWHGLLRLVFDDVDVEIEGGEYLPISEVQAQELVDFVIREVESGEVTGILVHCGAGISRSAAVARWISKSYALPFHDRYQNDNRLVYSRLLYVTEGRLLKSWASTHEKSE